MHDIKVVTEKQMSPIRKSPKNAPLCELMSTIVAIWILLGRFDNSWHVLNTLPNLMARQIRRRSSRLSTPFVKFISIPPEWMVCWQMNPSLVSCSARMCGAVSSIAYNRCKRGIKGKYRSTFWGRDLPFAVICCLYLGLLHNLQCVELWSSFQNNMHDVFLVYHGQVEP